MRHALIFFFLFFFCCGRAEAESPAPSLPRRSFYLWLGQENTSSFFAHADRIDEVFPFFYSIDAEGRLSGKPDAAIVRYARERGIDVMPVVWNTGFQESGAAILLRNEVPRREMLRFLLDECRLNGFHGIQFDIEGLDESFRESYSDLARTTAAALHEAGLRFSVAVVPGAASRTDSSAAAQETTEYSRWHAAHWRNMYDYEALAAAADFVVLMAYDQHTRLTPPGPIGGIPWVKAVLESALTKIPKEKLSLGIPLYGRRWIPMPPEKQRSKEPWPLLSFGEAARLAASSGAEISWDNTDKAPWFLLTRGAIREYVFFMDSRAVSRRQALALETGLRGSAYFVLGKEDPKFWEELTPP